MQFLKHCCFIPLASLFFFFAHASKTRHATNVVFKPADYLFIWKIAPKIISYLLAAELHFHFTRPKTCLRIQEWPCWVSLKLHVGQHSAQKWTSGKKKIHTSLLYNICLSKFFSLYFHFMNVFGLSILFISTWTNSLHCGTVRATQS